VEERLAEVRKKVNFNALLQRWSTGGPRAEFGRGLDLLRPPPSLRFIFKNLNFTIVMAQNSVINRTFQ
jgi:hypothetical protein